MNYDMISVEVKEYGRDIMGTKEFDQAVSQTHHYRTSLAKHSFQTACEALSLCRWLKRRGVSVDEEKVVRLALIHDFGLLGRDEKFKNNFQCGMRHAGDSAHMARDFYPEIDEQGLEAIRRHMWPLALKAPKSWEGFVLCVADKRASVKDILNMGLDL